MKPSLALELSLWHETQVRTDSSAYGFNGDREVEANTHLFWTRALLAYSFTNTLQSIQFTLTGGTSVDADRLDAFRLGGMLPLSSEFPLTLPGYFFQELSARRFIVFDGQYSVALDYNDHWHATVSAATAVVDYLPGFEQPGAWNSGVSGGLMYKSRSQAWQAMLTYAYGFDTLRSNGRGSSMIGLLFQFDFEAHHRAVETPLAPRLSPNKLRGFDRIFGR